MSTINREAKTVRTSPDSDLAVLLREAAAAGSPVVVEVEGETYTLRPTPKRPARSSSTRAKNRLPSPSAGEVVRSRAGIKAAAGSWKNVNVEGFRAFLQERRRVVSDPPARS